MPVLQFDEKFRQCFWDLASTKEDVRERSTNELMNILEKEQETSANDAKKLSYALTRLIRGLSSSREGARQGFSVALTQLLRNISSVTTSSYIKRVGELLPKSPNAKGKEEREIYYGRIFAILVLAKAERFAEDQESDSPLDNKAEQSDDESDDGDEEMKDDGGDSSNDESGEAESDDESEDSSNEEEEYNNPLDWAVSNLHELSKRKEQFEQLCYYTTAEIFRQLPKQNVLDILESVHSSFFPTSPKKFTASQLYFALTLEHDFQWTHPSGSVYTIDTLKTCEEALVGTFASHPEIHIVWKPILQFCFPEAEFSTVPPPGTTMKTKIKASNKGYFDVLWSNIIESRLFHSDSHQKKYLAFQLTEQMISHLSPAQISNLFTDHFSVCIVNSLHSNNNFLYSSASNLLKQITNQSENMSSKAKYALSIELLKLNRNFDGFSKTKTVECLVSQFELPEIEKYLNNLCNDFYNVIINPAAELDEEQTKAAIDSQRIRSLNRMLALCRTSKHKNESFLATVLHFYLLHGFFELTEGTKLAPSKKSILSSSQWKELQVPSTAVTHKVTQQCRTTLTGLFKEFATLSLNTENDSLTPGEMKSGEVWPSYALRVYEEFAQLKNSNELSPLSPEASEALSSLQELGSKINKQITKLTKKIDSAAKKNDSTHTALKIQYAYRLLVWNCAVLLHFESDSDIVEAMEDLRASYLHITTKKSDGPDPYDVVTDIIVSLLTRSSAYLRTVATRSFNLLTETLPATSVQILIDIIDPSIGTFDEYEDDDLLDDEMDEEDDDGVPFTLEEAQEAADRAAAGDDDMDEDSDDSDDSDSDDDTNVVVDEELEKELLKLQQEDVSLDDIYIEDAPIEDLKKFNDRLQMMLASMKKQARQSDEKRTMQLDHKMKILDLLDSYMHHDPTNPIAFSFLGPLFKAIISAETNKSQLNYLMKLRHFAIHKFPRSRLAIKDSSQAKTLLKFYAQISPLCVGKANFSQATLNCVNDYIQFTVRLLLTEGSHTNEIVEALYKTFKESVARPLKGFNWFLWSKLILTHGNHLMNLAGDIVDEFIIKDVKPFAVVKGFEFLDGFCKKHAQLAASSKSFRTAIRSMFSHIPQVIERKDINTNHLVALLNTTNSSLSTLKDVLKPKDIKSLCDAINGLMNKTNSQKIRARCNNCVNVIVNIDPSAAPKTSGKRKRQREEPTKSKKKVKSSHEESDVTKVSNKDKSSNKKRRKSSSGAQSSSTPKKSKTTKSSRK